MGLIVFLCRARWMQGVGLVSVASAGGVLYSAPSDATRAQVYCFCGLVSLNLSWAFIYDLARARHVT